MNDGIEVDDADFDSGFSEPSQALTETPDTAAEGAAAPAETAQPDQAAAPSVPAPNRKFTQAQIDEILKKAASIDEVRSEYQKKFDTMAGTMGSMKQMLDRLQSTTGQGAGISLNKEDFKEMIDEGYPDLAEMQVKAMNRAFDRLKASGAAPNGASTEQVAEIIKQQLGTQATSMSTSLREQITQEIALDHLAEQHSDYKEVLNSADFQKWSGENKIKERKDRAGVAFEESLNANFIGKILSDFKASQKQAATRTNRLAAAVTPRGAGGFTPGPDEDDEFNAGFNG